VKLYVDADGLVLQVGEGKGRERTAVNSTVRPRPGRKSPVRHPLVVEQSRCPTDWNISCTPPLFLVLTCILLAYFPPSRLPTGPARLVEIRMMGRVQWVGEPSDLLD